MLAHLLAFGVFAAEVVLPPGHGEAIAGAEHTTAPLKAPGGSGSASIPLGATFWASPMDPADRKPYAIDWSKVLEADEQVDELVHVTMSEDGAMVGVQIDTSEDRTPIIDAGGKKVQVWFLCLPEFQDDPAFSGAGVNIAVTCQIRTDAEPYRQIERTSVLTVRQQ